MPVDPPGSRAQRARSGRGHTNVAAADSSAPPASRGRAPTAQRAEFGSVEQGPPKPILRGTRVEEGGLRETKDGETDAKPNGGGVFWDLNVRTFRKCEEGATCVEEMVFNEDDLKNASGVSFTDCTGSIDYFEEESDDDAAFDDADQPEGQLADRRPDWGPPRRASLRLRRVLGVFGSFGADSEEAESLFESGDFDYASFDPFGDSVDVEQQREGRDRPRQMASRQQRKRGSILDMVISFARRSSNGGGRTPISKEGDGRQEGMNVPGMSGKMGSSPCNERCTNSSTRRQGRRSRNHGTGALRRSKRGSLLAVIDAIKFKAGGRHPATEDEDLSPVLASTRGPDKGPSRDKRGGAVDAGVFEWATKDRFSRRGSLVRCETASTTILDWGRESSDCVGAGWSQGSKVEADGSDRAHELLDDAGRRSGAGDDRTVSSSRRRGRRGRAKERGSPPPRGSPWAMVDVAKLATIGKRGSPIADEDARRHRPRPHCDEASGQSSCKYSAYVNAGRSWRGEAGAKAGLGGSGNEKQPGVVVNYNEMIWSILY